jgi:hypothetical protein
MLQESRSSAPQGRTNKPLFREDPIFRSPNDRLIGSGTFHNPHIEVKADGLHATIIFHNRGRHNHFRIINSSVPGCGPLRAAPETIQVTCDICPSRPRDFVICHGKTMHVVTVRCEVVKQMKEDRVCGRVFRLITSVRTTRNGCCVTEQYPIAQA